MQRKLRETFKATLSDQLTAIGFDMSSETVFAKKISSDVLGCIGYLESTNAVRPFLGVRFEQVEKIYREVASVDLVIAQSVPRYFPTLLRSLHHIKEDDASNSVLVRRDTGYLHVEYDTVSHICDQILADVREVGLKFIETNLSLSAAAKTMAEGRGGGIGSIAYRLPIIYWLLGQEDEALSYLGMISSKDYPIGDYDSYARRLVQRMNSKSR
ncbi:hypothetical protein [Bradyrhizobium sp. 21]|uniref:hypothetical protein n=1 Tax=Bradyrhizobium sp. 21 TaxID=2782666 RepID=UPI001FFA4B6B|nr:hypothetical protein [Bradyrhizobium sp. 21]MCK1383306.1 hypothetical protein [Bradyrhizobium sp. 21]